MDKSAGDKNAEEEENVRKAAYAQEECVIDRHCFFPPSLLHSAFIFERKKSVVMQRYCNYLTQNLLHGNETRVADNIEGI